MAKSKTKSTSQEHALPFVRTIGPKTKGEKSRRSWWVVKASGDYMRDNQVGEQYAYAFLSWQIGKGGCDYLGAIVRDMPNKHSGVEVGFLWTVGQLATHAYSRGCSIAFANKAGRRGVTSRAA